MGGPIGGAVRPGTAGSGGPTEEARVGNEGETVVLVNGAESVERSGNRGGTNGLVRDGSEVKAGFGAEMEGEPLEMELMPARGRGLVRPVVTGGALTVEATLGGGVGLVGGVVSIPQIGRAHV